MPEVLNRKESALKTITAQAWKLGTVGFAFVLSLSLLISSTPSNTALAAIGETTTCTITITETDRAVLNKGGENDTVFTHEYDNTNTDFISAGTVLTSGATGEKLKVHSVQTAEIVLVDRGHGGTIGATIVDNTQFLYRGPIAAGNAPKTCMGDTSSDMTVTVKSAEAGYSAKIAVDRYTPAVNAAQVVKYTTNNGSMTDATATITLDSNVGLTANDYIKNLLTGEIVKIGAVDGGAATLTTVVRGQFGTTAAAFVDGSEWVDLAMTATNFADANQVIPKINGLSGKDSYAEAIAVSLDTFTAATSTVAAYYSATFTLSSTTAGEAMVAVHGPNSGPKYVTDPDLSNNVLHVNFRGAPVSYTDDDLNGAYTAAGDTVRSSVDTAVGIGAVSTATIKVNMKDTKGQELVGKVTYNLSADACAAGVRWTGSGNCDLVITTTNLPDSDAGWESVGVKGLATTGNFRYTYTATYTGSSGDLDLATATSAAQMILFRSNNVVSTVTAAVKYAAVADTDTASDATQTSIPAVGAAEANHYYVEVKATDSAGNPAAASITVKDLDGDGTDGLGTDIKFEASGNTITTKITAAADGEAIFYVNEAIIYTYSSTDPIAGTYPLNFYYTSNSAISADVTVHVRSAAKTFTIAGTSGQADDGSLPTGTVGTYTVSTADINGNRASAAPTVTFIVTGMGTGATAGSFVPTDNSLSVSATTGGVISIVAPTVTGTGTIAVIYAGKVVASQALTFGVPVTAGATVSGTGCTASTTGSYTCVVTEGGTAAEVATAASAVSVWQSDASGVLQGYVVGTPDFVDTGLASTAAIAANSAVIVVR